MCNSDGPAGGAGHFLLMLSCLLLLSYRTSKNIRDFTFLPFCPELLSLNEPNTPEHFRPKEELSTKPGGENRKYVLLFKIKLSLRVNLYKRRLVFLISGSGLTDIELLLGVVCCNHEACIASCPTAHGQKGRSDGVTSVFTFPFHFFSEFLFVPKDTLRRLSCLVMCRLLIR